MTTNPVHLIFSDDRRQVLGLLLLRPDESFHLREIARLTGVPTGSLHRELRALTDAGLLLREPMGNQVRHRANRASPIYPELAAIFRKTAGLVGSHPVARVQRSATRGDVPASRTAWVTSLRSSTHPTQMFA
jgi:hypothetical protein